MRYVNWSTDIFEGFYESGLYNCDTIYNINANKDEDDPVFDLLDKDFVDFENTTAEDCAGHLMENMHDNNLITKIDFVCLDSPRYYNFETDKLVLDITCDWPGMIQYIKDNKDDFNKYLQDNFTSCDGFWSFVPNNYAEFMQNLDDDFNKLSQVIIEYYILKKLDLEAYKYDCYESAQNRLWQYLTPVNNNEQDNKED